MALYHNNDHGSNVTNLCKAFHRDITSKHNDASQNHGKEDTCIRIICI